MTASYLPYEVKGAMIQVCGRAFHYKNNLIDFLARSGVPESVFRPYENEFKFNIARNVIGDLEKMGDEGKLVQRRLLTDLCRLRDVPDVAVEDRDLAVKAMRELKEVTAKYDLLAREERDASDQRQKRSESTEAVKKSSALAKLCEMFREMAKAADRQARGYNLESLLTDLFALSEIPYRPPYRLREEQIDGQFHFRGFDYIVEARWRQELTTLNDLLAFKGKVDRKIESTRGMFLSVMGFVPGSWENVRHAGSANLILMHGHDLALILEGRVTLVNALEAKCDKASQEGLLLYPISELLGSVLARQATGD